MRGNFNDQEKGIYKVMEVDGGCCGREARGLVIVLKVLMTTALTRAPHRVSGGGWGILTFNVLNYRPVNIIRKRGAVGGIVTGTNCLGGEALGLHSVREGEGELERILNYSE